MDSNRRIRLTKEISATKVRIYALISRQLEVLDHLEYSLDQDQARKNHLVYISHIVRTSYNIARLYRRLMRLQDELGASNRVD